MDRVYVNKLHDIDIDWIDVLVLRVIGLWLGKWYYTGHYISDYPVCDEIKECFGQTINLAVIKLYITKCNNIEYYCSEQQFRRILSIKTSNNISGQMFNCKTKQRPLWSCRRPPVWEMPSVCSVIDIFRTELFYITTQIYNILSLLVLVLINSVL
jgi:hypothetical protein